MHVPRLDRVRKSRVNSMVRFGVLLAVLCAAQVGWAGRAGAAVTFSTAKGGEALGYLASEVARVVTSELQAAGADGDSVAGRIEELQGERVRLSATVRGRAVNVEGELEHLDELAAQLASKIAALGRKPDERKPDERKADERKADERKADERKPDDQKLDPKTSKPEEKPATSPTSAATSPTSATPSTSASTAPSSPSQAESASVGIGPSVPPPSSVTPASASPPYASPPGSDAPTYPPPYRTWTRVRVVVHAVPDPPSVRGAGLSATQALYYFLGRRLRVQVVATGVGLAPQHVATDEAWRMGARAVVMARLESVEYVATPPGSSLRCRIELVIVRDGHLAFRRTVEPALAPVNAGGYRQGRELDPVFVAVSQALEGLTSELGTAIGVY